MPVYSAREMTTGICFGTEKDTFIECSAVCNAKLLLTNLVGSSHDSTIFNKSCLKYRLDNVGFKTHYILGDGGYDDSTSKS